MTVDVVVAVQVVAVSACRRFVCCRSDLSPAMAPMAMPIPMPMPMAMTRPIMAYAAMDMLCLYGAG